MISQRVIYAMHRMNLPRMLKAGPENDLQKAIAHVVEAAEKMDANVKEQLAPQVDGRFYRHANIKNELVINLSDAIKELERALKECGV